MNFLLSTYYINRCLIGDSVGHLLNFTFILNIMLKYLNYVTILKLRSLNPLTRIIYTNTGASEG